MGDLTHEEKLYRDIDGPGGYEKEDPWRYRYLGPHAVEAGVAVQHLAPGQNQVLEFGSAEGLLAMRVCETSHAMQVAGSDVPSMRHVQRYLGLELSSKAVEVAQRRAEQTVWKDVIRYQQADGADESQWPDEQFDLVLVSEVLPYLPEAVREGFAHRVFDRLVKDGGHLVVFSWMTLESGRSYAGDWPVHQIRSEGRLLTTKPKGSEEGDDPYVYRWVAIQKKSFDYPWATLW